jgi:N-acetylneuraminic acid mutarotase
MGRKVYVFGGQLGDSHNYAAELQNNCLYALDLDRPEQWTEVHRDRGLQGLALVSDGQRLIRLGGFAARNQEGDAQDLLSSDQVEQFNFQQNRWDPLPSLPEPRSSFDAVVIDGQIYVVGGWKQSGAGTSPQWLQTAYRLDLKHLDRGWQPLPEPPFQRRAVALGQVDNQLVVVGGMNSDGRPTTAVAMFDVAKQTWREGPSLPPGDGMEGFGSSCFNVDGQLICSTYSGAIYRLDAQLKAWEPIGRLEPPRFFHRLVPIAAKEFAILGGVNMDRGKILEIYRQSLSQ